MKFLLRPARALKSDTPWPTPRSVDCNTVALKPTSHLSKKKNSTHTHTHVQGEALSKILCAPFLFI